MDNIRTQMPAAAEAAGRIVLAIPESGRDAPTPCPDWDVRGLAAI
ncbi:hypothetical protein [Actinomadura madurae]|nr:hypothetical protein [Actinomadura madurae]